MPIFNVFCDNCQKEYEVLLSRQEFNEEGICVCPTCLSLSAKKLPTTFAAHYKGSGFYTTDYARKPKSEGVPVSVPSPSPSSPVPSSPYPSPNKKK